MVEQKNSADELSLEPDVLTSGRKASITGLIGLLLLFGAGGAWAAITNLSGAVVTSGQITVQGNPKTIQHLDGGVVSEIAVENGSLVKQGDVVIRLDDALLKANVNIYTNRLLEAVARRNRLIAEREEALEIKWDDETLGLLGLTPSPHINQAQQKLFETRRDTLQGEINQLGEQINQYHNQLAGVDSQKDASQSQIELLEEELEGLVILDNKGLTAKNPLRNLRRLIAELQGRIGEAESERARIENAINESEIQILQSRREFLESVLTELGQTDLEIRDMTQQFGATRTQVDRAEIRAPIDGMVHELSIFTIGGVVEQGAPLMQIIPQSGDLDVEISIEPQFVDDLFIGQPAGVRFSAFNQRTTPELSGTINSISPNTVTNRENGLTFYLAKVSVPQTELDKLGEARLLPGMPVEVFVKTKDRTPLSYLLKPLTDQINRAFREE